MAKKALRALAWWVVPAFFAAWVVSIRAGGLHLLEDSDTAVLLRSLAERDAPLSWFWTDWPLGNHFYRPVPTLLFELDRRLYGDGAVGFGMTNAILAALLLFVAHWLFQELAGKPALAAGASALLGFWMVGSGVPGMAGEWLRWAALVPLLGLLRHGRKNLAAAALASGGLLFLSWALPPLYHLPGRVVQWLPGRTASTMAVLLVLGLAAAARWMRVAAERRPEPPATATDVPATKGTPVASRPGRHAWMLLGLAAVGWAGALASYEQAVTLVLVAPLLAYVGYRAGARFPWQVAALACCLVAAYAVFRPLAVDSGVSDYQQQQFRSGPGVWLSLMDYALPGWNGARLVPVYAGAGLSAVFLPGFWGSLGLVAGTLAAAWLMLRKGAPALGWLAWLMAFAAYLPMAWLHHFEHYHLFPAVFRALSLAVLATLVGREALSAVGPPALQAPPRRHPAPGSLLRP